MDDVAESLPRYDQAYYDDNGQSGDRIALWWYERIARHLAPSGARAIDFGSGAGHFARRLSNTFVVSSCDASAEARALTSRNAPRVTIHADPGELPDGCYDLVTALHVLEHVPDPRSVVRGLVDKLVAGGRMLIVVPNPDGLGHWLKGDDWFAYRDPTHCSLLSTDEWREVCVSAGLNIDRITSDGLWDGPYVGGIPGWLQKPFVAAPAAAQVLLGRTFVPARWGECLVIIGSRA